MTSGSFVRIVLAASALAYAACGGGGTSPTPAPAPAPTAPATPAPAAPAAPAPAAPTTPPPAAPPPAAPAAAGESNFGTVSLTPGFIPDPSKSQGRSGGPDDASVALNSECAGWVTAGRPDHLLVTTADFANLRILANGGEADITLVVKKPDGTFLCNDDGPEGFNPLVEGAFPAGTYQIWVGNYASDAPPSAYTIGFTELGSVTAASLVQ